MKNFAKVQIFISSSIVFTYASSAPYFLAIVLKRATLSMLEFVCAILCQDLSNLRYLNCWTTREREKPGGGQAHRGPQPHTQGRGNRPNQGEQSKIMRIYMTCRYDRRFQAFPVMSSFSVGFGVALESEPHRINICKSLFIEIWISIGMKRCLAQANVTHIRIYLFLFL